MNELDFDATYRVEGMDGIAWQLVGYETYPLECEGHPDDGEFNGPIGETFYCDGSCNDGEVGTNPDMVIGIMVGDNRKHTIDVAELTVIDEEDYCHSCGQIGCGHDVRS